MLAVALLGLALLSCASAPRSRWEKAGAYTVCTCVGTERQPTPSEAASFADDERVDLYCEGKVKECRPGKLRDPRDPRRDAN